MEFVTQRELLEYAGRNPNDRSLIQRWIASGRVWKTDDGLWHLEESRESVLLRENKELKEKIKKSDGANSEGIAKELERYKGWLKEANEAYEELGVEHSKELKVIIDKCFYWMQSHKCLPVQTRKEFCYWVRGIDTGDIQFSPDEVREDSELPF